MLARLRQQRRHADRHAPDQRRRRARQNARELRPGRRLRRELHSAEPIEIPDLYLKLPGGEEIPQDPQVLRFTNTGGGAVLAETIDRGHRANLGPAIVRRDVGKGQVIYIGSGLEAVYAETRMKRLRAYLGSLIDPFWRRTARTTSSIAPA